MYRNKLATLWGILALAVASCVNPAYAQVTISSLPAASALTGTEKIPAMQGVTAVRLTPSQISTYLGTVYQPLDADLTAIAALTTTTAGRALLDDADATAQRVTLGVVIGTNVQAYDADLAAIAGLTSAADKLPYFTGSGTAAVADFTVAGRAIVDDADATAQRTTLGLGSIATQAASGVTITGGSITGITDLAVADGGTGASTASAARTNLGVAHTTPAVPSGRWLVGQDVGQSVGSPTAATADSIRIYPTRLRESMTITDLGVRVTTAAASGNVQIAIYAADSSTLAPTGSPVCSTSSLSTASTGFVSASSLTCTITPGVYWFATLSDTNAATAIYSSKGSAGTQVGELLGSTTGTDVLSNNQNINGFTKSHTFGTWPTLTGSYSGDSLTAYTSAGMPIVAYKR